MEIADEMWIKAQELMRGDATVVGITSAPVVGGKYPRTKERQRKYPGTRGGDRTVGREDRLP